MKEYTLTTSYNLIIQAEGAKHDFRNLTVKELKAKCEAYETLYGVKPLLFVQHDEVRTSKVYEFTERIIHFSTNVIRAKGETIKLDERYGVTLFTIY